jgi:hypothetical protein
MKVVYPLVCVFILAGLMAMDKYNKAHNKMHGDALKTATAFAEDLKKQTQTEILSIVQLTQNEPLPMGVGYYAVVTTHRVTIHVKPDFSDDGHDTDRITVSIFPSKEDAFANTGELATYSETANYSIDSK